MKNTNTKQLAIAIALLTPNISSAQFGGVIEGDFAIYDVSGAYSYGNQFGVSYRTAHGMHYLLGSTFYLEQDDTQSATSEGFEADSVGFGLAYRYGFSFFKDFEPYIEYGWNNISASYNTTDALGNPSKLEPDNSGDCLSVGILYRLWEDLHLKAEIGCYGLLSDQFIETPTTDSLGNRLLLRDTVNLSGSIGLSFKF